MEEKTLRPRRDRLFYAAMVCALTATVFAGFSQTFYLRSLFGHPALEPFLLLHGVVFTSWLALLIVQTLLVVGKRTATHMQLGMIGGGLAAAMVAVGVATAIRAARRSPGTTSDLAFLIIPLGDIFVFTILATCGFLWRRQPDYHKRFMILATVAILAPATARLPFNFVRSGGSFAFFLLADMPLAACLAYDLFSRRRIHPANIWGGLLIILSQPARVWIGGSDLWIALARRIAR